MAPTRDRSSWGSLRVCRPVGYAHRMTKVRFLRRLVTVDHGVAEVGSVVDVDDRHAERLTQLGYTEPADTVTPPDDDDGRDGDVKPATTSASSSRRTRKR